MILKKTILLISMSSFLNNCGAPQTKISLDLHLYKPIQKDEKVFLYRSKTNEYCGPGSPCFENQICMPIDDFNSLSYNYLKE